tara:strand:- start:191 stop:496 length:306 start_codon:yes stop_codon:yes gene_type:complete
MKKILTIGICSTFISSAALAFGGFPGEGHFSPRHKHDHMLTKMDSDGNGVLTKDEIITFHTKAFADMDKNSDGTVTKDEMHTFHEARMKERLKKKICDSAS